MRSSAGLTSIEVGTCGIEPPHLQNYLALAMPLRSPLVRTVIHTAALQPSADEWFRLFARCCRRFAARAFVWRSRIMIGFVRPSWANIIGRCDGAGLGICLDTANSLGCGEDVQTVLRKLGPWIVNVHLKDFRVKRPDHKKGFVVEGTPARQACSMFLGSSRS